MSAFTVADDLRAVDDRATRLYEAVHPAVVQLRVIDLASGDKSTIGSGFQIDPNGRLVSNYHVIADYVNSPDRYRLEFIESTGRRGGLSLIDVDVVNDLALLWTSTPLSRSLALGSSAMDQGQRIFSLGNPLDLAMTIVEGTFNGFVTSSRLRRMLISASLNPGMSGGPAINDDGEVIGVNVSHGAEQISFLIPVETLSAWIEGIKTGTSSERIIERITDSLLKEQREFYQSLVENQWQVQRFGDFLLPWRVANSLNCWGGSSQDPGARYHHVYQECESQDGIYLDYDLEAGTLHYDYHWFESSELSQLQFYSLLEHHFRHSHTIRSSNSTELKPFRCSRRFVRFANLHWRMSWCARAYTRYPGLHDFSAILATAGLQGRGLLVSVSATGIAEESAAAFMRRFLGIVTWLH